MKQKNVLLIAGGGTLGSYAAEELLAEGYSVDVICLEDKTSDRKDLTYIRANATIDFLKKLFAETHYDGIINFLHYTTVDAYKPYHELLTAHTDRLIFLSSYRVYADLKHPITEDAPRLLDVTDDREFLDREDYALPKARCEDYIRALPGKKNWTIVRPVISFSEKRFDMLMYCGRTLIDYAREGKTLIMPESRRFLTAGLDWAGNTGRLIARLLFCKSAIGETYTISSAPGLTWNDVANIYRDLIGLKVEWVDEETYLDANPSQKEGGADYWRYVYDRCYDRAVDNRKVLSATGLKKEDFKTVREGVALELERFRSDRPN